jgi:cell division protein FtsZ
MEPQPLAERAAVESEAQAASVPGLGSGAETDELTLDTPAAEGAEDELLLDSGSMLDTGALLGDDDGGESFIEEGDLLASGGPETQAPGNRSWITGEEEAAPAPRPAREGGTLFERMSNIARGASKAQVEEDEDQGPARLRRDPLDIPRFLGRQNNQ